MRINSLLLFGLLCISPVTQATILPGRVTIDRYLAKLGSDQQVNTAQGIDWGLVPGPFYTPELGIGIGVAAVGLYRPDRQQKNTPLSSLALTGFASSTGAFGFGYENDTFLHNDQWRFYIDGDLSHRPLYYWGQGYREGRHRHDRQRYDSSRFNATPQLLYRLRANTYAGVGWAVSWERASALQDKPSGGFSRYPVALNQLNSGISLLFSYDTRDFIANPSHGQVLNIHYNDYLPSLGSDNRLNVWDLQYDLYHPLNDSTLLAWELYSRLATGHVPWTMQGSLGDSRHLRGYYQGRFRDRNIVTTQLELRKKLSWRHGVVGWIGAGSMSQRPSEVLDGHWLPSVGVGYRFEFKKRMNVRLDYGVGQRSSGFYFQVGEAF